VEVELLPECFKDIDPCYGFVGRLFELIQNRDSTILIASAFCSPMWISVPGGTSVFFDRF